MFSYTTFSDNWCVMLQLECCKNNSVTTWKL